jgi:hypothetical protein
LLQIGLTVLASLLVVVAAGWVLLVVAKAEWVTFPLLVLFPLSIPIGLMLVGAQAGRLLDLQQMKAKYSRVVGGFTIGLAVGGLLAAWLARVTGDIRQLLVLDLVPLVAFAVLLAQTGRRYPAQLHAAPTPVAVAPTAGQTLGRGRVTRLVLLVLGYSVASAAATQLLYFMVWDQAVVRYPDAAHLAAFLGAFGAIMNTVSIAFVVLLAGRLLRRFGVGFGLAANPVAMLTVVAAGLVTGAHAIAALDSDLSALAVVLDGADPELRLTAAMLLARSDGPLAGRGRALCSAALESTDASVAAAALSAVTQGPDASYVAALMTLAARHAGSRSAIGAAVAAHGGLPGCDAAALQRLAVTREQTATRAIEALGLRRDDASLGVLTQLLSGPDRRLARAAGHAIAARGHALEPDLAERLMALESSRAARAAAAAQAIADTGRAEHLCRALDDEIRACARQARRLVGAAFGNQWLTRTVAQLASSADGDRALAVETLELELGRKTAARLLELVDPDVDGDGRRALLAAAIPADGRAAEPWLNELLDDPHAYWQDTWLRACALYAASELAPESAAAAALTWQDAADPVLAETARWLRGELARPSPHQGE